MPSEYKPVERQQRHIIGCRIKPGVTPGGFSRPFSKSLRPIGRKPVTTQAIKEAANAALEKRGALGQPSYEFSYGRGE